MNSIRNLRDCRHYATVACTLRIIQARTLGSLTSTSILRGIQNSIYRTADPAIHPALDTIKRVMEIDTDVDNPGAVLMHAGIAMKDKETEQGGEPT